MPEDPSSPLFITLSDGRRLAYRAYGSPRGRPVVFFHGSPGSSIEARWTDTAARDHNYRVLAFDRPGMGDSHPHPGRRIADLARDTSEFADALGIGRFDVMGHSGGAQGVLACAALLPGRVGQAIDLGGWAPLDDPEIRRALAPLDRLYGALARLSPVALFTVCFAVIGALAHRLSARGFARMLESSMGTADRQLCQNNPAIPEFLRETVQRSFRQGPGGPARDAWLLYRDWGIVLTDISRPVHLVHGDDDHFAPFALAEAKASAIPTAKLHPVRGGGHLFVDSIYPKVFDLLAQQR